MNVILKPPGKKALLGVTPMGTALLIGVYVFELAGRFELGRMGTLFAGVDIRVLLAGVISVWFLAWIAVERPAALRNPTSPFLALMFAWVASLGASTFWAVPEARILEGLFDLLLLAIFTALTWVVARRVDAGAANILFIIALLTSYVYLLGAAIQGPDVAGRLSAFGGGPNVFVRIMLFGALAALALAVIWHRPLLAIASVPPLTGAVLSGSRGGLVSAVLVLALAVAIAAKRIGWPRIAGAAVPFLAVLALVWRWLPGEQQDFVRVRILEQTIQDRYVSGRDGLTSYALELIGERPLLGAGLGSFSATYRPGEDGYHAHNLFLSTAAEGGLLSTIFLIGTLIAVAASLVRFRPLTVQVQFLALFACFILIASLFSGDYYDTRFLWYFAALTVVWSAPLLREGDRKAEGAV